MKKYRIENLDCANCALEIESELNKLDFIRSVKITFATKQMLIDTDDIDKVRRVLESINSKVKLLETEDPDHQHNDTYNVKRELITIGIYLLLFIISIFLIKLSGNGYIHLCGYVLLIMVYLFSGREVILTSLKNISKGKIFDENFLMTFATIAAFIIGAYSESVAVMLFYRIGEFFQGLAVNRSRKSINSLLEIRPDYAVVMKGGKEARVSPNTVNIGDVIIVRPGEKIPLDGVIIKGKTSLDMRALTGESVPKSANKGDEVMTGSLNITGVIEIKVTKLFSESSAAKILDIVENAASNKAKTETFITVFSGYYTPAVFFLSLFVAVLPPVLGFGSFSEWIYRALIILVVSCPCALVISVPLGYFGGIGCASGNGILVKGANFLEALVNVKAAAFDKTGTLTKGVFKVTSIVPFNGFTEEELLKYAEKAESQSNHPIAISIKDFTDNDSREVEFEDYEEISGQGVKVIIDSKVIMAGNDKLLHKFGIDHDKAVCNIMGGVAHVAVNDVYAGYIVISDELKEQADEAISELRKLGVSDIIVLTGDNRFAAEQILKNVDIEDYYTDLLPEDKARIFKEFVSSVFGKNRERAGKSLFAGDGINDAPVLALADIGVAMGAAGNDAAIETADVVIMNDSLIKIADAIKIAKKTRTIIWQNIIFALTTKAAFIVLGFFGIATIWEAVFGDVGVALLALLNSTRILRYTPV